MPQTASATKALRSSLRRRVINDRWRGRLRTSVKELKEALAGGQKADAQAKYLTAQKTIDRAARHRIITKQAAARKKSRFARAVAKLA